MKFTIEHAALLKALATVHRVVDRRNSIPILANVLIRAGVGSLYLEATDLDLGICTTIAATVDAPGSVTAPAHMLYDFVRKVPAGSWLEAHAHNGELALRAGRSRFNLQTLPESDFPHVEVTTLPHRFTLPAPDLMRLIDRTQYAISTDETRYYLNGIFLHAVGAARDWRLRMVATDGHRLSLADTAAPAGCEAIPGIILPRKTVGEIRRLVDGTDAAVTIELSDIRIRLALGDVVLTSKLIDGTFPDYERVIPRANDKELRIDRDDLAQAVDRVATVAKGKGSGIKLQMSRGRLAVMGGNPNGGTGTEELTAEYRANDFEIGFNTRYLVEALANLAPGDAVFLFGSPGDPARVEPPITNTTESGSFAIIMPMKVA